MTNQQPYVPLPVNDDFTFTVFGSEPTLAKLSPFEALGNHALRTLAVKHGAVERSTDPRLVGHALTKALEISASPFEQRSARSALDQYGKRLAYYVETMRDPKLRDQLPNHLRISEYLATWKAASLIRIGGGVVAGPPGAAILTSANRTLRYGHSAVRLRRWHNATDLGLVGAARSLRISDGHAAVFDFGQSSVKRAIARVERSVLKDLYPLPPVSAVREGSSRAEVLRFVKNTIIETISDNRSPINRVAISIAADIHDSAVLPQDGTYGVLAGLSAAELGALVSQGFSPSVQLTMIGDGAAAGLAINANEASLVLSLGTALCVGIPQQHQASLPVAPRALHKLASPGFSSIGR